MSLWQMSFYGGVLIFAIIVSRRLFRKSVPRGSFLILWAAAAARLLIPVGISSEFNIYSWALSGAACTLCKDAEGIDGGIGSKESARSAERGIRPKESTGLGEGGIGTKGSVREADKGIAPWEGARLKEGADRGIAPWEGARLKEGADSGIAPWEGAGSKEGADSGIGIWKKVWLEEARGNFLEIGKICHAAWKEIYVTGLLVCVLFYLKAYIRCRREFCFSLPAEDAFVQEWEGKLSLRRKVSVRQSEAVDTPLTYGVLHPVILLPKKQVWEDARQLEFALAHEMEHIRHLDAVKKLILAVATCVHWFNPLVWRMQVLACRDIELLCDARVIRRYGFGSRAEYASALIHMEEKKGSRMVLGNSFSENNMEERIVAIMKMKRQTVGAVLAAAVMVAGVTAVFATAPAAGEAGDAGQSAGEAGDAGQSAGEAGDAGQSAGEAGDAGRQSAGEAGDAGQAAGEAGDAGQAAEKVKVLSGQTAFEVETGAENSVEVTVDTGLENQMRNIAASEEFSEYEKFGLSFQEETGRLMYQGEAVGYFKDEIKPGTYRRFYTEEGTAGIVVVRGSSGKIIGFHTGGAEEVRDAFSDTSGGDAIYGTVTTENDQSVIVEIQTEDSSQSVVITAAE